MGKFTRENLPDPLSYYLGQGLILNGKGTQRSTGCTFHGSRNTLGINIVTGAFLCRAGCGAHGGDVLDYHRAAYGMGFVEAAKALGAYQDNGNPHTGSTRPTSIPARDLLKMVAHELTVITMLISDSLGGRLTDPGFERYLQASARVIYVAEVANGHR
jgi:hypothetical protein